MIMGIICISITTGVTVEVLLVLFIMLTTPDDKV